MWVTGNYSAEGHHCDEQERLCPGNLVPTVAGSTATCGLVARGDILFPYWYEIDARRTRSCRPRCCLRRVASVRDGTPTTSGGLTSAEVDVDEDLEHSAPTGTWVWKSSNYVPPLKDSVTIKGARAMKRMLGFSTGYNVRNFDKDPVLAANPPPLYPKLPGKNLGVSTWAEY